MFRLHTLLIALCLVLSLGAEEPVKPRLAVLPLKMEGSSPFGDISDTVNTVVSQAVMEAKAFQLVERGQVKTLLKEGRFQSAGMVDEDGAVQLGKHLGVRLVLLGSCLSVKTPQGEVSLTLSLRLVDVETAAVAQSWLESVRRPDIGEALGILSERLQTRLSGLTLAGAQAAEPQNRKEVLVVLQAGTVTRTHRGHTQSQQDRWTTFNESLTSYEFVLDDIGKELARQGIQSRFRVEASTASPSTLEASLLKGAKYLIWVRVSRHAKSHSMSRKAENTASAAIQVFELPGRTLVATRELNSGIANADLFEALPGLKAGLSHAIGQEFWPLPLNF